jgi:hypothetical protein
MRELIYLSQNKLQRFQTERSAGLWQRVRQVEVKAPLGAGVNVGLSDPIAKSHPDLAKVVKHIDRSDSPARWFEEEGLEPGEWFKFEARLNYVIYSEIVESYGPKGALKTPPAPPPPPLFFWQPKPGPKKSSALVLLLHGSPENLVGVNPADLPVQTATIRRTGSVLSELSKFLFQLRTVESEEDLPAKPYHTDGFFQTFEGQIYELCQRLYKMLPSGTASRMAGYAQVTALMEVPDFIGSDVIRWDTRSICVLLATPLYVEQLPFSSRTERKGKRKRSG